jgi:hypothetical protein
MLFQSELLRIFKSRRSIIFIAIVILLPFLDLIMIFNQVYGDYIMNSSKYAHAPFKSQILHPAFASFLSGNSRGHIAQMLLIWILPLYIMIIYSDSSIQEKMHGYSVILYGKVNRMKFIRNRLIVSFTIPMIICFISMAFNFIVANIIFSSGKDLMGAEYTLDSGILSNFSSFCLYHPSLTYCFYIIGFSIIAGGCGILCTSISMFFNNYKIAYPLVFFIWFAQVISPFSLTYAIQPFIEYGPNYFVPAIAIYTVICSACMIMAIIKKVRYDEI